MLHTTLDILSKSHESADILDVCVADIDVVNESL